MIRMRKRAEMQPSDNEEEEDSLGKPSSHSDAFALQTAFVTLTFCVSLVSWIHLRVSSININIKIVHVLVPGTWYRLRINTVLYSTR